MPCGGGPSGPETDEFGNTIDDLSRLLCGAVALLTPAQLRVMPGPVARWWKAHQKADNDRRAEERRDKEMEELRKKARSRLTKQERIALGVDDD